MEQSVKEQKLRRENAKLKSEIATLKYQIEQFHRFIKGGR